MGTLWPPREPGSLSEIRRLNEVWQHEPPQCATCPPPWEKKIGLRPRDPRTGPDQEPASPRGAQSGRHVDCTSGQPHATARVPSGSALYRLGPQPRLGPPFDSRRAPRPPPLSRPPYRSRGLHGVLPAFATTHKRKCLLSHSRSPRLRYRKSRPLEAAGPLASWPRAQPDLFLHWF